MKESDDKIVKIINAGSEIIGAASGGVIGFLLGGPAGATLGGPLGIAIQKTSRAIVSDVASRILSHREEVRVGATASTLVARIKERLDSGEIPRNDGFFDVGSTGFSPADSLLEAVLLKSKSEYEEKKVKYLGYLYANLVLARGITAPEANHIIKLAEELTYIQFSILSFFARTPNNALPALRDKSFGELKIKLTYESITILQDVFSLCINGLVAQDSDSGEN
jgi:hypothetical protein